MSAVGLFELDNRLAPPTSFRLHHQPAPNPGLIHPACAFMHKQVFAVDIHPAARIGKGILLDHGTGVVIGETAVIEDNCSLLQV